MLLFSRYLRRIAELRIIMEATHNVRQWIEDLPKRGRIAFSMEDLKRLFPSMPKEAVQSSIYRLIGKGRVCSVWRNFYIVVPDEYALRGFVPPIEYVDGLMRYLGIRYYVGLLSAAALHGSSHQQPQSFMVVVNSNNLKKKKSPDAGLHFIAKSQIQDKFLQSRNTSYGEVKISDPVMTVLDLILYENRVGGLERAASVIDGLVDELDLADSDPAIWTAFPIPVIQRFGFIIESILEYHELGDVIYNKINNLGITFRKSFLDPRIKATEIKESNYDRKWKMIANTDLEID